MRSEVSAQADAKQSPAGDDAAIDKAVRRSVGIAALRRLRGMIDAEHAQQAVQARWAGRLSWVFALAAALLLAWLAFR